MSFITAMETAENEELVEEVSTGEADAAVAEETNNIVEATQEIAGEATLLENAASDSEELAVLGDKAEEALESGEGLSEDAAEIAIVAVENALFRLGMRREEIKRKLPATESFGNANTRIEATKFVVETIGSTLSRVWTHIKNMSKMILEKIISFFGKLFNSVATLRKSLEMLKKRVEGLDKSATAKSAELTGSIAKNLEIAGSADLNTWKQLCANVGKLGDFTNKASAFRYKLLNGLATAIGSNKSDIDALVASEIKNNQEAMEAQNLLPKTSGTRTNWSSVQSYGPFVGGVIMTAGFKSKEDEDANISAVTFEKVKESKAEKVAVLTIPQINEVVAQAEVMLKQLESFKKTVPEEKSIVAKIGQIADKIVSQFAKNQETAQGEGLSKEQKKGLELSRRGIMAVVNAGNTLLNNVPSIMFRTVAVSYDYASKSFNQYSAKAEAK